MSVLDLRKYRNAVSLLRNSLSARASAGASHLLSSPSLRANSSSRPTRTVSSQSPAFFHLPGTCLNLVRGFDGKRALAVQTIADVGGPAVALGSSLYYPADACVVGEIVVATGIVDRSRGSTAAPVGGCHEVAPLSFMRWWSNNRTLGRLRNGGR